MKQDVLMKKQALESPKQAIKQQKMSPHKTSNVKSSILNLLKSKNRDMTTLKELNNLLNSDQNVDNLLNLNDENSDGSLLHVLTKTAQSGDNVSWRMVYSLSNAGIDVNIQNGDGNTALHLAYIRGYTEIGFEFIEALLKVGTDLRIKNNSNKIAFKYMEDIEQLKCMYEAHFPGIWQSVDDADVNSIQRLMNALIRVNTKKNGVKLIDYAKEKSLTNKTSISEILEKYKNSIDLIHSVYAMDVKRITQLSVLMNERFDPNIADFSYCFSWFKSYCRNIPKFLLEMALETKQIDIIKIFLASGCDVNLPNSKTGNPFYFHAFEVDFKSLKNELLSKANLNVKNQQGQSILFYIVTVYLSDKSTKDHKKDLIEDFGTILRKYPLILTHRDNEESTIIEAILSANPSDYRKLIVFLKEISDFILQILEERNFKIFQEMVYQSYGLILLNTPIYLTEQSESITFEEFIQMNQLNEIKIYLKKIYDSDFIEIINNFAVAIKNGNLNQIKEILRNEKNYFLLRIRDYVGRSCLHLACLYTHSHIVKFFLQQDANLIKAIDNLNRTALHYAYALRDHNIIEILLSYKINKYARDAKFLLAEEYELDEVLNDDWFRVKNFKEYESKRTRAVPLFMMCFQFKKFKKSIEINDIETIKKLNTNLKLYELSILDFPMLETNRISDQDTGSLLELSMKIKSYSVFRYLLEQMYDSFSSIARLDPKLGLARKKQFDLYINELREIAEDSEMYEIIDIIDNTVEDKEIADITYENRMVESENTNEAIIQNILAKKSSFLDALNDLPKVNQKRNYLHLSNQSTDTGTDISKNTKICSIL